MIINIAGGTGTMGKVHKPIFEAAGHKVILSGRKTSPNLEEAAQIADVTIVSVPIPATEEVIQGVAPYSGALMDFTGVKTLPIEWMLNYSNDPCQVAGLHPLYREPATLREQTIIYCPTFRTGNKCKEVLDALVGAGADITIMNPEQHDRWVLSRAQNSRTALLAAYALLLKQVAEEDITLKAFYKVSPPPTKALIDLIARQFNQDNDELYASMRKFNPFQKSENSDLILALSKVLNGDFDSASIRGIFGEDLAKYQKRAEKIISLYGK